MTPASRAAELLEHITFYNAEMRQTVTNVVAAELARVKRETVEKCRDIAGGGIKSAEDVYGFRDRIYTAISALAAPKGE